MKFESKIFSFLPVTNKWRNNTEYVQWNLPWYSLVLEIFFPLRECFFFFFFPLNILKCISEAKFLSKPETEEQKKTFSKEDIRIFVISTDFCVYLINTTWNMGYFCPWNYYQFQLISVHDIETHFLSNLDMSGTVYHFLVEPSEFSLASEKVVCSCYVSSTLQLNCHVQSCTSPF